MLLINWFYIMMIYSFDLACMLLISRVIVIDKCASNGRPLKA